MSSEDEPGTPPITPSKHQDKSKRKTRRRSPSSSSSSSEEVPRKSRKRTSELSTRDFLRLVKQATKSSPKNFWNNNSFNNVLPEFDPSIRTQTIEGWLRKVNECAVIYGWDERQIVHFSLQKLVGLAKRWFEALPTVVFTWDDWQIKLKKAFPSEENYGKLLEEMLNRTSRSDESFREYYYDKLGLLNRCDISGKRAVDCIIYGISDRSVRNSAQAQNCNEPEDLFHFLAFQKAQIVYNNKPRERNINKSGPSKPGSYNVASSNSISCYNCRERGHPFFKCTKPIVRCKKCNRVGHDNDSCKLDPIVTLNNKPDKVENLSERKTLKISSHDVGKFVHDLDNNRNAKYFKSVIINDRTFKAYIDFGSECTLLCKTDAELLNSVKNFDEVPIVKGFGQSTVKPLYKINAVVKIDEIEAQVEVLVVDDIYMPSSLIIGQNFTELPFVTVLKDVSKLTFYRSPWPAFSEFSENILKLYITDTIQIVNTSVVPVHSTSKFTGDILINGYSDLQLGREFCLLQGAFSLSNGKGVVIITNFSTSALTLKSNILIARAIPFNEQKSCHINRIVKDSSVVTPLVKSEIITGPELNGDQIDRLYTLLQSYRDCFATNLNEIGCSTNVEMKINLIDNKPVVYRPYRLSHYEREKVRETIYELLFNDVIQESTSDYASPILMVKKKTGEQRLCVDFRALNNKTVKDRFPLPLIDDQISNLSGNCFFTTLDLASGYYQIPMSKESRHLTGFVTPDGHYEFKRMPFGLSNAPAVFQRMINNILGNRRFEYALAYLDDVLIPSKTIHEMFQRLEDVLKVLRQNGLTLKLTKCRFFDSTVSYLGYEISSQGIQPSKTKILAVTNFPKPRNVHEVRQFLGLTGYFRKFIKGYGEIARPLTSLLKKDCIWQWSNTEDQAFLTLKERLSSRPVLALYDPTLETELHTDASSLGVGGIVMQWQKDIRVLKPIAYFSRQTSPEEKYLHSYELKTLAVVCSLKKFRVYLLGIHFKVYTDCAALRTTLTKRDLIPRIARWWLQISEFTFDIEYRPGVQMSHVDALSRNTSLCDEPDNNSCVGVYTIVKDNWLLTLQLADPEISRIFKILKPDDEVEYRDIRMNYVIKDHTVYKKVDGKLCLVVPRSARWQICRANHDEIGHLGFAKTYERIKQLYWFPKQKKFVKKYVAACLECAYNKDNAPKQKSGYLYPIEKVQIPFHTVHLDHLGPFVKSKNGNTHILNIVDAFTKYIFVRAVKDLKTKNTVKVLERIFYDFGVPARIVSDRGTSFTSAAFEKFCVNLGIKHILNSVACPRANGQVERYNQTVLNSLSAQNFSGHERDWDKCLGKIQWGINNTINATTNKTATEALFGTKLRDVLSNKLNTEVNNNSDLHEIREQISKNINKNQIKQKEKYDANRIPAKKYNIGDLVKICRNNFDNNKKSTKLLSKFVGPYRVTEVLGKDRYRISDIPGFKKKGKPYKTVIAADRIRSWIHTKALQVHSSGESSSEKSNTD